MTMLDVWLCWVIDVGRDARHRKDLLLGGGRSVRLG